MYQNVRGSISVWLFTLYSVWLREEAGVAEDVGTRYVDQRTACEAWFSPATLWVSETELKSSGLMAPLPTKSFHWPLTSFNNRRGKTILILVDSINYLSKWKHYWLL